MTLIYVIKSWILEKRGKEIIYTPDTSILHKQSRTIVVKHIPTHPKETEINRETPIEKEAERKRQRQTERGRGRESATYFLIAKEVLCDTAETGALRVHDTRYRIRRLVLRIQNDVFRSERWVMVSGCVYVCACNAESLTFSSLFAVRLYYIYIYTLYLRESEGSDDGMKKKRKKKERKIRRRNSRAGRRTTVDLSESEQGTQVGV